MVHQAEKIEGLWVEVEPGDMTRYHFLICKSITAINPLQLPNLHGWDPADAPIVAVASIDGPIFGGLWLSVPRIKQWWADVRDKKPAESLMHYQIGWAIGEMGTRVKDPNPWTVRAAFLAVLLTGGVI